MTTMAANAVQCPECGASDAVDLSGGMWLCLQCRTEWDPSTVPMLPPIDAADAAADFTVSPSLARVLAADTAGEVLRAPAEELGGSAAVSPSPANVRNGWEGLFVRYERMGVTALVVEDRGGSMIELQDEAGTNYKCKRSSCVILGDDLPGGVVDTADIGTVGGDDTPIAQTILAVAGLTLTVALDAIDAAGDNGVGNPRIGWLPPPCNELPEVEQGVAYAAAFLIHTWGLDTSEVRKLAANLMTGASNDVPESETE